MTRRLTVGLAQLNARVGDLAGNAAAILAARDAMPAADVILTPELSLVGYPPEDLVLKPALVEACARQLGELAAAAAAGGPALLVGAPVRAGDMVHNAMALLAGGRVGGAGTSGGDSSSPGRSASSS